MDRMREEVPALFEMGEQMMYSILSEQTGIVVKRGRAPRIMVDRAQQGFLDLQRTYFPADRTKGGRGKKGMHGKPMRNK